ncbi:unnamed protein product [Lepeophtheirus salmonis]|uniref:(salmon louse) hypothetical protein n=1 Tax=Lepeophtheirus salmonis TaxID=72036 RepID=A0A7R8CEB7_LEPSM|nr:unnamed protein product [Lepeophtheirus salmonis]CAF2789714.1 unnamed protein product [Lepeophtheirus salmonis]
MSWDRSRRVSAQKALKFLQNISEDQSEDEIGANSELPVRTAVYNIFSRKTGPVSAAIQKINMNSKLSVLSLMIDEKMLRHILKCTVVKGKRVMGEWNFAMEELEQFVGLMYARGYWGWRIYTLNKVGRKCGEC